MHTFIKNHNLNMLRKDNFLNPTESSIYIDYFKKDKDVEIAMKSELYEIISYLFFSISKSEEKSLIDFISFCREQISRIEKIGAKSKKRLNDSVVLQRYSSDEVGMSPLVEYGIRIDATSY